MHMTVFLPLDILMKLGMNIMPLEVPEDLWFYAVSNIKTAAVWASWLVVTLNPFNTGPEIFCFAFFIRWKFHMWLWCKTWWLWVPNSEETSLLNTNLTHEPLVCGLLRCWNIMLTVLSIHHLLTLFVVAAEVACCWKIYYHTSFQGPFTLWS
jgi:hypothetical protein